MPHARPAAAAVAAALALALATPAQAWAGSRDVHAPGTPTAWLSQERAPLAQTVEVIVRSTRASGSTVAAERAAVAEGATVATRLPALRRTSLEVPAADVAGVVDAVAAAGGEATVAVPRTLHALPSDTFYVERQKAYLDEVRASQAWDVEQGDASVLIAVVDSGVDVSHPDLVGKVADAWNVVDGTTDVTDAVGHGTFVAGIAAAASDNDLGITGVGFDTRLLAVKVADASGEISLADEAAGIVWAADHGADVINLSLGGLDRDASGAEDAAVAYAQSRGVVVVASAGNEGGTAPVYPAALDGVVGVGATDGTARADFSNHGSWVDVAAPGVDIASTIPSGDSGFGDAGVLYASSQGTSFSAPIVAGEVALLLGRKPTATPTELRQAVTASASGFAGLGLGTGRVDLAGALEQLTPTTVPTVTAPAASATVADVVTLTASSTAKAVQFTVDGAPLGARVPVVGGTASTTWASWGAAQGDHTVRALDCTSRVCGAPSGPTSIVVANAVPTLTSPTTGVTIGGLTTLTADGPGGGMAFLVDGVRRAFDSAAPYTVSLNASDLTDGGHQLTVRTCSASGLTCAGPVSPATPVTARSLHPAVLSVTPNPLSPNGDGRNDTARIVVRLPDTERVDWQVRDAAGAVVRSTSTRGTQPRGDVVWTWDGKGNSGASLPDATYNVQVLTSATVGGAVVRGAASRTVRLDRTPAVPVPASTAAETFYPRPDGYRDSFSPAVTVTEPATLTLFVLDSRGRGVARVDKRVGAGRSTVTWNGRTSTGAVIAAGTYTYYVAAVDSAGNRAGTARYVVHVNHKRLVPKSAVVQQTGDRAATGGGTAGCAGAFVGPDSTVFAGGLWLANGCLPEDGYQEAGADWVFTLPSAIRYDTVRVDAFGFSEFGPSTVVGAVYNYRTGSWDSLVSQSVDASQKWRTVSRPAAAGHTSGRTLQTSIAVGSGASGESDFDVAAVRVLVGYSVLG